MNGDLFVKNYTRNVISSKRAAIEARLCYVTEITEGMQFLAYTTGNSLPGAAKEFIVLAMSEAEPRH